jgi:hypothetical protein
VVNAKIQYEYNANHLMNLDLAESYISDVWLNYNNSMSQNSSYIHNILENVNNEVQQINYQRKQSHSNAKIEIDKYLRRRDISILTVWQIQSQCQMLEKDPGLRQKRGLNDEEADDFEENEKRMRIDNDN